MSSDVDAVPRAGVDAPARRGTRLRLAWLLGGAGLLTVVLVGGLLVGAADLGPGAVVLALLDRLPLIDVDAGLTARQHDILLALRLPRLVLGMLVGATLSLCGAAYQGVFRNPLADPYLLGAAAGAGLGATLAVVYGLSAGFGSLLLPAAAFVGALGGVLLAYGIGGAMGGVRTSASLILAGVATASFLTAVQTYVQQRNADTLRQVYAWILGRLSTSGWDEVVLVTPYVVASTVVILLHRRLLDVLAVGEDEASTLGIRVARVRLLVVVAASLGTAAAVAVSGLIGFVGIIVPHTVRLLAGSSYRVVLPLSLLFGAAFLVGCDVIARTVAAPAELPIGVVTAFFGAPFFAVVLRTSRRAAT